MKCPKCNHKIEEFSHICEECNYIFQPNEYHNFIYEYIEKYSNIFDKSANPVENVGKIIFKNICTENVDNLFDSSSAEEFAIKYYKQKGYKAFFAENNYWILLFSIIYFSDYFITQHHIYKLVSMNVFF